MLGISLFRNTNYKRLSSPHWYSSIYNFTFVYLLEPWEFLFQNRYIGKFQILSSEIICIRGLKGLGKEKCGRVEAEFFVMKPLENQNWTKENWSRIELLCLRRAQVYKCQRDWLYVYLCSKHRYAHTLYRETITTANMT